MNEEHGADRLANLINNRAVRVSAESREIQGHACAEIKDDLGYFIRVEVLMCELPEDEEVK